MTIKAKTILKNKFWIIEDDDKRLGTLSVDEDQYIKSNIPLNRKATSEEIAKTILFLVSESSFFITGAELTIDGGMSAR